MAPAQDDQLPEDFDWPSEADLAACPPCKDLTKFLDWMCSIGEIGDLRIQRVHSLHIEWCCLFNWRPLSTNALSHALGKLGVSKSRPRAPRTRSGGQRMRPTYYRIASRHGHPERLDLAA